MSEVACGGSFTFAAAFDACFGLLDESSPPRTSTTTTIPAISATPSRPPNASVMRLRRAARFASACSRSSRSWRRRSFSSCLLDTGRLRLAVRLARLARAPLGGPRLPALVDEVGDLAGKPLGRDAQLD